MKTNRNVVYDCTYHCVWCPKYRRPVLVDDIERGLKEILHEVCREKGAEVVGL